MARPRPRPAPPQPDAAAIVVPDELLAGACVEVWLTPAEIAAGHSEYESPTGIPRGILVGLRARRRYTEARAAFLAEHDLHGDAVPEVLRARANRPWSFHYLAVNDPDRLAELLCWRGLPDGWRPRLKATASPPAQRRIVAPHAQPWRSSPS